MKKGHGPRKPFLDPALAQGSFLDGPLHFKRIAVEEQTGPIAGTLQIYLLADSQIIGKGQEIRRLRSDAENAGCRERPVNALDRLDGNGLGFAGLHLQARAVNVLLAQLVGHGSSRFQRTGPGGSVSFSWRRRSLATVPRPGRRAGWAFVFGQQGCVFPKPASYPAPRLVRQPFL